MTLVEYKRLKGMSLTQLASQLGVKVSTVHGWLNGSREPHSSLVPGIIVRTDGWVRAADLRRDAAEAAEAEVATSRLRPTTCRVEVP